MSRRLPIVLFTVTALSLGAVGVAFAGGGGSFFAHHRRPNPEQVHAHLEKAVEHVLDEVDATAAQEDEITAILDATIADLDGVRDDHEAHRTAVREVLTAETIDRDALEALRQDGLERADEVSARIVQAVGDVAEVLTPEQRAEVADLAEAFHSR